MSRNGHVLQAPRPPGRTWCGGASRASSASAARWRTSRSSTQAHAAYMGLKRSAKAIRGRGANIFTQWVGDPDALGSAVLLSAILRHLGARGGPDPDRQPRPPAEPQPGRALRDHPPRPQPRPAAERACTAWSTPRRRSGCWPRPGWTRCEDYFFVADHHADPDDVEENCRAKGVQAGAAALRGPRGGLDLGLHGGDRRRLRRRWTS